MKNYEDQRTVSAQLVKNDGAWVQFGRNENTQNAQALLTFEVPGEGRKQDFIALTPAAMEYSIKKLHACGFEGYDLRAMERQTPHGKVELVLGPDEYKGKRREKIIFINAQGGMQIKRENRLRPDELDDLSALAKGPGFDDPREPGADDDKIGF